MTAIETEDLAVITGPVIFRGILGDHQSDLTPGEVVQIADSHPDKWGDVWVTGLESDISDYIAFESLTLMAELYDAPDVKWGDLLDPDYVHDYVWTGEDDDNWNQGVSI